MASYFRSKDEFHPLEPGALIEIDTSQLHMWPILAGMLMYNPHDKVYAHGSFSQRQWHRMRMGHHIDNSAPSLFADVVDSPIAAHLTDEEVSRLSGTPLTKAEEYNEHLLIRIPDEILKDGKIYRTSPSWQLSADGARRLATAMTDEFWESFFTYIRDGKAYRLGMRLVRLTDMELIERFMSRFNIRSSADEREKKTLKRNYYRKTRVYHIPTELEEYAIGVVAE